MNYFLIALFLLSLSSYAQRPNTFITQLDKKVKETSGLIRLNGRLITHNDSGGELKYSDCSLVAGSYSAC